jgi:hypothetical protein
MQNKTMQNKPKSPMDEQYELQATLGGRRQRAVVTEIAASLRALEIEGVALLQDYPAWCAPPSCAGWVLVPWPNRVASGKWSYNGVPGNWRSRIQPTATPCTGCCPAPRTASRTGRRTASPLLPMSRPHRATLLNSGRRSATNSHRTGFLSPTA